MSVMEEIRAAYEDGLRIYEDMTGLYDERGEEGAFAVSEMYGTPECSGSAGVCDEPENVIAFGDDLAYMAYLIKERNLAGKIQLIYVDPPFFSGSRYEASLRLVSEKLGRSSLFRMGAYDDRRSGGRKEYLTALAAGFFMMRDLLSDTGCLWVHLDGHAVHYVKVMLDEIMGEENFVNEIIWTYSSGGASGRRYARKHDNLLFYGRGKDYRFNPLREKSYNRGFKPYRFRGVEEFEDEKGWYTLVNMKDVWNIDMVGRTSSERSGYATQKPEKLLERIVSSCSDEGDLCADFFAGSGTLGAVCQRLGRRWMMCDKSSLAVAVQVERMGKAGARFFVERQEDITGGGDGTTGGSRIAADIVKDGDDIEVTLTDYMPAEDTAGKIAGSGAKAADEVGKYISEDPLSLIRCWSVDIRHDCEVHRAERLMTAGEKNCVIGGCSRGAEAAEEKPSDTAQTDAGIVSIVGYDVFGNRFAAAGPLTSRKVTKVTKI